MKRVLKVVVILLMLTMSTEANMAKLMDEDVRQSKVFMPTNNNSNKGENEAQRNKQFGNVPAWLGAMASGVNAGAGTRTALQSTRYNPTPYAPAPASPSAPVTVMGTERTAGAQRVSDGQPRKVIVQTQTGRPAQVMANQNVIRGTARTAGAQRVSDGQAPNVFVPVPQPVYETPGIPLGSGEAPVNTMSDYLRSLFANNAVMSNPYNQPSGYGYGGGYGFGSRYGGNWGYGGGGYDSSPAWLNAYLRLNNWNIG